MSEDRMCECDAVHPHEEYQCEECAAPVCVCLACSEIVIGCACGHCEKGAQFNESE